MADANSPAKPSAQVAGGVRPHIDPVRCRALEFAMQAALGKPTQFIKAQEVVQEADRYLAFLEGRGDSND